MKADRSKVPEKIAHRVDLCVKKFLDTAEGGEEERRTIPPHMDKILEPYGYTFDDWTWDIVRPIEIARPKTTSGQYIMSSVIMQYIEDGKCEKDPKIATVKMPDGNFQEVYQIRTTPEQKQKMVRDARVISMTAQKVIDNATHAAIIAAGVHSATVSKYDDERKQNIMKLAGIMYTKDYITDASAIQELMNLSIAAREKADDYSIADFNKMCDEVLELAEYELDTKQLTQDSYTGIVDSVENFRELFKLKKEQKERKQTVHNSAVQPQKKKKEQWEIEKEMIDRVEGWGNPEHTKYKMAQFLARTLISRLGKSQAVTYGYDYGLIIQTSREIEKRAEDEEVTFEGALLKYIGNSTAEQQYVYNVLLFNKAISRLKAHFISELNLGTNNRRINQDAFSELVNIIRDEAKYYNIAFKSMVEWCEYAYRDDPFALSAYKMIKANIA